MTWQERAVLTGLKGVVSAVTIAADGSWMATGSDDATIRVWDTTTWRAGTMVRVENEILACAWLGDEGLAAGGAAGLFLFDFLSGDARQPA